MVSNCPNCGARTIFDAPYCQQCGGRLQASTVNTRSSYQANDELHLEDIMAHSGNYAKGDPLRRFLAMIVDFCVAGLLIVPFFMGLSIIEGPDGELEGLNMVWLLSLLPFIYLVFKDCLFNGRSVGKLATGLMVLDMDSYKPCGVAKSLGRNFVSGVMLFVPLGFVIDCVLVLADNEGRKVGDRAVKTQVINTRDYTG